MRGDLDKHGRCGTCGSNAVTESEGRGCANLQSLHRAQEVGAKFQLLQGSGQKPKRSYTQGQKEILITTGKRAERGIACNRRLTQFLSKKDREK